MIVVTGATGKLGSLVVNALLEKVAAKDIAVAVRNPQKAAALAARGVEVRLADYGKPETLTAALEGADKVLLISSSEVGQRAAQHQAVIEAAVKAGAKLIAYTSILHADTSKLALAVEHKATEAALRASGVPYAILRNGWYAENYTDNLAPALAHGALVGSAGQGRIAAATRADFAAAAVEVLTGTGHENKTYELAGDVPFTMSELAAELSKQSGKTVPYNDLPASAYTDILIGAGLPRPFAEILVDADVHAAAGELDDTSGALHRLIGRATTPIGVAVKAGLAAL
jgi:NAD(P)H dehydrogenase (quinone)